MIIRKGSAIRTGPTQLPVSGQGNTALINSDKRFGHFKPRAGGMRQNVTLPIPTGPGFPPIPSRNDFVVRKHSLQVPVARWTRDPGFITSGINTVDVMIHTPSNRLRLAVYGVFESLETTDDVVIGTTAPTWSIRAMSKNPKTGQQSALQLAYPATGTKALPDSYEMDSAVTLLRARLNLAADNFDDSWSNEAFGIVYATWEPNTPIADRELEELYATCAITPGASGAIAFTRPVEDPG